MDNWKYLVDTVRDMSYREDKIPEVLRALSYVLDEKGHSTEAHAALMGSQAAERHLHLSYRAEDWGSDDDDGDDRV